MCPCSSLILVNTVVPRLSLRFSGDQTVANLSLSIHLVQNQSKSIKPMAQPSIGAQASRLARDFTLNGVSRTRMPKLVYGTAWKKDATANLVYTALKVGFRGIDTAAQPKHYNEQGVAAGFKKAVAEGLVKRADVFVSLWSCWRAIEAKAGFPDRLRHLLDSDEIYSSKRPKPKCAV